MGETKRNLILIGPTGSGKTAVGRQLARDLGLRFLDSDHEIEKRTGVEVGYIFEKEGEEGFRDRETDVIRELAAAEGAVIATGGGAVLRDLNRQAIADGGVVIYLKTSVSEQLRRTQRSRQRPLLNTKDPRRVLEAMASERGPLYEDLADIAVDTSNQRVRAVAKNVRERLEQRGVWPLQTGA